MVKERSMNADFLSQSTSHKKFPADSQKGTDKQLSDSVDLSLESEQSDENDNYLGNTNIFETYLEVHMNFALCLIR